MMPGSVYVAMRHNFSDYMPLELRPHGESLLFARWLVLSGRLSDWGLAVEETVISPAQDRASGGSPWRRTGTAGVTGGSV